MAARTSQRDLAPIKLTTDWERYDIWLGSEDAVREAVGIAYGDDPVTITADGWRANVGWDRDSYDLKREFLAESGYEDWWESCREPAGGIETRKVRRAWRVAYAPDGEVSV
jgi:hypothetical protein